MTRPPTQPVPALPDPTGATPWVGAALVRGLWFFAFWLLLADPTRAAGADLAMDLGVGLLAAALATWASLGLLPPAPGRRRYGALARLAWRFLWQSVAGGLDVALRALSPNPRLKPGYLAYPVRLPEGPARAGFGALTSLVPGTLPVGSDPQGRLIYHCLDLDQPVAAGLAADEALLTRVLGGVGVHD
jgi:multicomponent Na+:H+ antiporter subunit E